MRYFLHIKITVTTDGKRPFVANTITKAQSI